MENFEGNFENQKINRTDIQEASPLEEKKYFDKLDDSIHSVEDMYHDEDLEKVFEKSIFSKAEAYRVVEVIDTIYKKNATDPKVRVLIDKFFQTKNDLKKSIFELERKKAETEDPLTKMSLEEEIKNKEESFRNAEKAIGGLRERIPLNDLDEEEETDPFYFSQN